MLDSIVADLTELYEQHLAAVRRLQMNPLASPSNVIRSLGISYSHFHCDDDTYFDLVKNGCYDGVCLGITPLFDDSNRRLCHEFATRAVPINAFHGTSIKKAVRERIPYKNILISDRKLADEIDLSGSIPINYDLFAGLWVSAEDSFAATRESNLNHIARALGLSNATDRSIVRYIIDALAISFKNSPRRLLLEIPGAYGYSLMPIINEELLNEIFVFSAKSNNQYGICVDISHLATWTGYNQYYVNTVIDILSSYKDLIEMFHISNHGSRSALFGKLYRTYHGVSPDWHIEGLDLMLSMDEPQVLNLLKVLRKLVGERRLIEVSEARTFHDMLKDYFPRWADMFLYDRKFRDQLYSQSQVLGYISE